MDGRIRATALVLYVVGLVVLAAATTAAYLAMRDVMAIGGSCASGGPYEVATPCPKGTGTLMVGGIFGWFVGAGLAGVAGSQVPGSYGSLALLAWPALFLSLGWNFLDFGLDPVGGGGTDGSLLFCGVLFLLMGGVPLLFGLKGLARALWPAATPPAAAGSGRLSDQIREATARVPRRMADVRRQPRPAGPPPGPSAPRPEPDRAEAARSGAPPPTGAADPSAGAAGRSAGAAGASAGAAGGAGAAGPSAGAAGPLAGAAGAAGAPGGRPGDGGSASHGDIARELERLADLHGRGALDDDEFERAKDILLGTEEDRP